MRDVKILPLAISFDSELKEGNWEAALLTPRVYITCIKRWLLMPKFKAVPMPHHHFITLCLPDWISIFREYLSVTLILLSFMKNRTSAFFPWQAIVYVNILH